jgi:futalosine hydrolase
MEGAGIFYVCKMEKTPCLQIRSISNYVEPRNTANWNIVLAVKRLNEKLILMLKQLA